MCRILQPPKSNYQSSVKNRNNMTTEEIIKLPRYYSRYLKTHAWATRIKSYTMNGDKVEIVPEHGQPFVHEISNCRPMNDEYWEWLIKWFIVYTNDLGQFLAAESDINDNWEPYDETRHPRFPGGPV